VRRAHSCAGHCSRRANPVKPWQTRIRAAHGDDEKVHSNNLCKVEACREEACGKEDIPRDCSRQKNGAGSALHSRAST